MSAVISFAIGYYAYKSYKASSVKGLLLLHLGFVILGVSLLLRFVAFSYLAALRLSEPYVQALRSTASLGGLALTFLQLIAYTLFAVSYVPQTKGTEENGKLLVILPGFYVVFFNPFLELMALAIIGYVVARALIVFLYKNNSNSLLVLLGFTCFFVSRLFFLFTIFGETLLFLGQMMQLFGFISFLIMLTRVAK
ncbi:MAG: hypothetical protein QW304_02385 [Thermoproteota archaeon]